MGLLLTGWQDNMTEALKRKNAFKPNVGFTVDPIPASRDTSNIQAFRPGVGGTHDPIPAVPAGECHIRAFVPGTGFAADPIPARTA
jgi:hypothetical protein